MNNIILKRKIGIPIFPASLTVMVVRNPVAAYQRIVRARKCCPDRNKIDDAHCAALCWRFGGEIYVAFAKDAISHYYITHELKHAADGIFAFLEAKPASEIYEYLIGYLASRVYRLLKKNKIRLHK